MEANNELKVKKQICDIGVRMFQRGFVAANDGNISCRISENEILATPTGVSKGYMTPEMIVKVNPEGEVLEGTEKPSSELKMHLCVYKEKPELKAVVHSHPPFATAFAIAGCPLDKNYMPETVLLLGKIPIAEYGTPSTEEIPDGIRKHIKSHNGVLLEFHGALTWGRDLTAAYYHMERLEFTAKITYLLKQLKSERELSPENIEKLLAINI